MKLYTIAQTAEALELSRSTVDRLIVTGQLPAVHIGRSVRIQDADLERFVKQRREIHTTPWQQLEAMGMRRTA
jgi:excisionase family DNA binding protein